MTPDEQTAIRSGDHWLCYLAEKFGTNAAEEIDALQCWDQDPGDVAISIMETASPHGITQRAMFRVDCWPMEKKLILLAAQGTKVVEFIRAAVIEKACRELYERL